MIAVLGLSISMMMPRISPVDLHLPVARQDDILDKIIPKIDLKDVPLHLFLKRIFTEVKAKYSVESAIDQNLLVSAHLVNAKLEYVLLQILSQHGFTFRNENKSFFIIDRSDPDLTKGDLAVEMPEFLAGQETSRYKFKNNFLFVSPKRTIGGAFELASEAANLAGFESWEALKYGSSGFAYLFPIEAIDPSGRPRSKGYFYGKPERFAYDMPYLPKLGFSKLTELFGNGFGNQDRDFRLIVLTFQFKSSFVDKRNRVMREERNKGLPGPIHSQKWKQPPEVTAYVYEFRRQKGSRLATLLKPGQSKISARRHLVLAGLWTEKELGK